MSKIVLKNNVPEMMGIKEIAEIFGISQNYARQLALSGAVKAVRVGRGKILINAQSVTDYFNSNYINAPESAPLSDVQPIPANLRR